MPVIEGVPLVVRLARPQEYTAVGDLSHRAYDVAGILGTDPSYIDDLRDAATRALESDLFVAVIGDRVIGTATYCPHGTSHAEISSATEAEFRMLGVEPAFNGRGIGRALVAACEERARAAGLERLVLSVITHNDNAARLYEHLGFTRAVERDWSPVPGVDLLVWEKAL